MVLLDSTDSRPLELAESLLARGVKRSSLQSGSPSAREWRAAIEGGWCDEMEEAVARAGDPRWEVWVHVAARRA
jgi:hypothetical protein